MDGKSTPSDVMEQTSDMSDVDEDLITEDLSGAKGDSTACKAELLSEHTASPNEDHDHKIKALHKDLRQTKREDTFTIGSRNSHLHFEPKDDVNRALPNYVPWAGKNDPAQHPPALLPTCKKTRANEKTQLYSSTNQSRPKTSPCAQQTHNDDLCAPILLACLFCNPLDCLGATLMGCHACALSLCSYLCGCQPSALWPLLNAGDCCGSLAVQCCCSGDCNVCSVCFSTTECLDLAMEFSQMVFH